MLPDWPVPKGELQRTFMPALAHELRQRNFTRDVVSSPVFEGRRTSLRLSRRRLGKAGDDGVERDLEHFALAGFEFGGSELFLRQAVDSAEAEARDARPEDPAGGQQGRGFHVGRDQAEPTNFLAHAVDHPRLPGA